VRPNKLCSVKAECPVSAETVVRVVSGVGGPSRFAPEGPSQFSGKPFDDLTVSPPLLGTDTVCVRRRRAPSQATAVGPSQSGRHSL